MCALVARGRHCFVVALQKYKVARVHGGNGHRLRQRCFHCSLIAWYGILREHNIFFFPQMCYRATKDVLDRWKFFKEQLRRAHGEAEPTDDEDSSGDEGQEESVTGGSKSPDDDSTEEGSKSSHAKGPGGVITIDDDEESDCSNAAGNDDSPRGNIKGEAGSFTPKNPVGGLALKSVVPKLQSMHLAGNKENSCHWHCMLPVFIAVHQAKLLSIGAEVTSQAEEYFGVIRDLGEAMYDPLTHCLKVCEHPSSCGLLTYGKYCQP